MSIGNIGYFACGLATFSVFSSSALAARAVGDFTGDGKVDVAHIFNSSGSASIQVNAANTSATAFMGTSLWASNQGGFWDTQKWMAGDFDGDGRTDLVNVFNEYGYASVDVHNSIAGQTLFSIARWETQQGDFWDSQKWVVGDFNGDGKDDLANIFDEYGYASIDVHYSNGSSFSIDRWATQQGGFWDSQKWVVGDFNGDGKDDLANIFDEYGYASIDVHYSNGSSFSIDRWATQQGGFWDSQKWVSGDFNGDGKADLANIFNEGGYASIDVHSSTGTSFSSARWATQQWGFWDAQEWYAGDFTGDGKADLLNVFSCPRARMAGGVCADVHVSDGYALSTYLHWATSAPQSCTTSYVNHYRGNWACRWQFTGNISYYYVADSLTPNPSIFDNNPINGRPEYCISVQYLPHWYVETVQTCN